MSKLNDAYAHVDADGDKDEHHPCKDSESIRDRAERHLSESEKKTM